MVHFDDRRLQILVEEDVEAQDLKAHRVLEVVWLAGSIRVSELRLHGYETLNDRLLDVRHHFLGVVAMLGDILHRVGQTTLVADAVFQGSLVLLIILVRLVDRVVRQVHVQVAEIAGVWRLIFDGRQPAQALLVHVDSQRINPAHKYVDSKIEL